MATERMKRLKDLMGVLSSQPASPERDRLLSEVRSRVVDLDTGVAPRAMLPKDDPIAATVAAKPPAPRQRTVMLAPKPRHAPAPRPPAPSPAEPVTWPTDLLTLEDTPLPHVPLNGDLAERPWTLGLRG